MKINYILILVCLLVNTQVQAYDAYINGIYYSFSGAEAEVTQGVEEYAGDIIIPSTVNYNNMDYLVTSIGIGAFSQRYGLTSITIPESVKTIERYAFAYCYNLSSIIIPRNVSHIGENAFAVCKNLNTIIFPDNITSIEHGAFHKTAWYDNQPDGTIYIGNVLYDYKGTMPANTVIEIRDGTTCITQSTFKDCTNLTSIIIPESVVSIGYAAFEGTNWYNDQPDGIIYINNVLYKYKGTMPANTTIDIKSGITSISHSAFDGCMNLTAINIPNSVTHIGDMAFRDCNFTSIILPESLEEIGNAAFQYCENLTSIIIPGSVVNFGYEVFYSCDRLNSVNILEGVTKIGGNVFENCINLTSISIPNSVKSIAGGTFRNCRNLTSINIPSNIEKFDSYTFEGCVNLSTVTIPSSVKTIEECAFKWCSNLTSIVNLNPLPINIPSNVFFEVNTNTCKLVVPTSAISDYKKNDVWKNFDVASGGLLVYPSVENSGYGYTTGNALYQTNEVATVTAYPRSGYKFTNWTINGSVVSTDNSYSFTVIEDTKLIANFTASITSNEEIENLDPKVYPNPTTSFIYMETESDIKVYTTKGILLQHTKANLVDLSDYPQDIYLVQIDNKWIKVIKK